jgi:hypothetical protein
VKQDALQVHDIAANNHRRVQLICSVGKQRALLHCSAINPPLQERPDSSIVQQHHCMQATI